MVLTEAVAPRSATQLKDIVWCRQPNAIYAHVRNHADDELSEPLRALLLGV